MEEDEGRPLDAKDFEYANRLDPSKVRGDEKTLAYAMEHEMGMGAAGRSAVTGSARLWPHGRRNGYLARVPYRISLEFTSDERAIIASAIKRIEEKTCVR